jgi:hypothetical protein
MRPCANASTNRKRKSKAEKKLIADSVKDQTEVGGIKVPKLTEKETRPKWKAEFYVKVDREQIATLGDTGCTRCCMSEEFFREHPHLQNSKFRPVTTHGKAEV